MHFGVMFWPLVALSVAAAAAYGFVFERRAPSFLRAGVKTLFMAALALAFRDAHPMFVTALWAAAVGDFFLAFDKPWTLPLGMLAFLLMQVCYAFGFFAMWMLAPDGAPLWPRYMLMALTLAVVAGFLVWFWSDAPRKLSAAGAVFAALALGAMPLVIIGVSFAATLDPDIEPQMNWPFVYGILALCLVGLGFRRDLGLVRLAGMIYAAIIVQMVLLAFWLPWVAWPAMLGALLFLISDGVLSAELFRMTPDAPARRITGPVVWWSYAGAQLLIAWGVTLAAGAMV